MRKKVVSVLVNLLSSDVHNNVIIKYKRIILFVFWFYCRLVLCENHTMIDRHQHMDVVHDV